MSNPQFSADHPDSLYKYTQSLLKVSIKKSTRRQKDFSMTEEIKNDVQGGIRTEDLITWMQKQKHEILAYQSRAVRISN